MVKKLTLTHWQGLILLSLIIGLIPAIVLLKFAPTAIQSLSGSAPESAKTKSMDNIYVICLFALFFLVIYVLIMINHITHSVGKKVKKYLAANPSDHRAAGQRLRNSRKYRGNMDRQKMDF